MYNQIQSRKAKIAQHNRTTEKRHFPIMITIGAVSQLVAFMNGGHVTRERGGQTSLKCFLNTFSFQKFSFSATPSLMENGDPVLINYVYNMQTRVTLTLSLI